jgi:serine/threonine protein phosphatase 1
MIANALGAAMGAPSRGDEGLAPARYPPAPDGPTLYLVGDIHGRLDLLRDVHRQIDDDKARRGGPAREIYLGDYIDRGPSSAGVVSHLLDRAAAVETVFLRGNHEQMLLDLLAGYDCLEDWLHVGGTTTLLSYGVAPRLLARLVSPAAIRRQLEAALPAAHRRFYEETRLYAALGPYLAVHAGVRPGIRLEEQAPKDLLSIRWEFLQFAGDLGFIVVHGHTPAMAPELRPNRINIDTGAFATNRLTSLRIDADGAHIMSTTGLHPAARR